MKANTHLIWKILAVAFVAIVAILLIDYIDRRLVKFALYDIERYTIGILIFGWTIGYSIIACFVRKKLSDFIAIGIFVSIVIVSTVLEYRLLTTLVGQSLLANYLVGYILAACILVNGWLAYKVLSMIDRYRLD